MLGQTAQPRQRPVIHLLNILVLACLLPGVAGCAIFLVSQYREERARQIADNLHLAREIGDTIDARLWGAPAGTVPSEQLSALLIQRRLPPGWLASVLDREGKIAARSRHAARFVGDSADGMLRAAIARSGSGALETVTRDGVVSQTTFSRSPLTGFTTVVGVPRAQLVGPLYAQLASLTALAVGLFAAGLLLARRMSRRISGSIQSLLPPAMALGRGETPRPVPAHIAEVAEVGAAIERAAGLLREREAELLTHHEELQQFKFFSENANEMLLLFDEPGRVRYANRQASMRLGYTNAELLSMTIFDIDRPVRREYFETVFMQCREVPPPPFERVYTCKDGSEFPVEITVTVLEHRGEWLMYVAPRDISERLQAEQALRWAATHDALTGLPNRASALALLYERLHGVGAGAHTGGAVLFVDLDRFKPVNDIHGHDTGDRVLQEVARRLQTCLAPGDLLARAGGDEFLAILPDAARGAAVARALLRALVEPIRVGNVEATLSASIGIAHMPEHGDSAAALLHAADMAMLEAKQSGRASAVVYSPEIGSRAQRTRSVEKQLQQALDHDGLVLHYQPIVNLATGEVDGVEALVRLVDTDGTAPGPGIFIPVAESSGLILPIGAWVATAACRQQAAWQAGGQPLDISVNVSALQFRRPAFADRVRATIARTGIDPRRLVIELTETALMENLAETAAILREVKLLGVRIALDDFGTG